MGAPALDSSLRLAAAAGETPAITAAEAAALARWYQLPAAERRRFAPGVRPTSSSPPPLPPPSLHRFGEQATFVNGALPLVQSPRGNLEGEIRRHLGFGIEHSVV